DEVVGGWIAKRSADAVSVAFEEAQAAIAPIYDVRDIFTDPQYAALGTVAPVDDDELGHSKMQNQPVRMSEPPGRIRWSGRARALLSQPTPKPVVVRINDIRSAWGGADLALLGDALSLAGVRIPKVESADDVRAVRTALTSRPLPLHCLIENARGVEAAFEIASADPNVASIALGEADLRSDLG